MTRPGRKPATYHMRGRRATTKTTQGGTQFYSLAHVKRWFTGMMLGILISIF